MEKKLLSKMLFGEEYSEGIHQYTELLVGLIDLKLKCPGAWWVVERAITNAYYHSENCVPFFERYSLLQAEMEAELEKETEKWEKDKEELVRLRAEVAKLKSAKKKVTAKSKKSKSKT